jgi:endonuclease/exonuclease/phosphatase (EEP) superfamily protein YafD
MFAMGTLFVQYLPRTPPASVGPPFHVMSINLLCVNRQTGPMLDEVRGVDPDVILLQEYAPHWHEALQRELIGYYPHYAGYPQEDSFGAAIYSRFPFREKPQLVASMGGGEVPQMRAVIDATGRDVVFYNIHLLPPRYLDYVIARNGQFAALLKELEKESLPFVLSGDFNFPATSPHARALKRSEITDAHDLGGYGRGATWPVNGLTRYLPAPGFRIDHVYLSPGLTCASMRTGTGPGSDHRSLIATVGFVANQ